jgi:phage shock protein A
MALITRVSRLFRADLHAVLDRIEEPELLLAQSIREMEEELTRDRQRVGPLQHEQRQLTAREREAEQSLQGLEEELDVCFESAREELARSLIRRRLETQRYRKVLAERRNALEQRLQALQARIEENRERLETMHQQTELLTGDEGATNEPWETPDIRIRDEYVEVAFLREKQKRSRS